jgi:ribonuclease BN (tRNA processing enzyme)
MLRFGKTILCVAFFLVHASACAEVPATCPPDKGVALQVLGSGGPIADDARASSAYLLWIDGKARVLIDAGGGSFLRFGEAGARFADLDFVGLSHFHTDHSADFPALLKSGNFSGRKRPLALAGPSGNSRFPGLNDYLSGILDRDAGAYAYLSGYLDGSGRLVKLEPVEVDIDATDPSLILSDADNSLRIHALGVPHGIVPALAFRITTQDHSFVFSSDQNMSRPGYAEFASGATALVVHMPIPEDAGDAARSLHAVPGKIAEMANAAKPQVLVVSHFMARSLRDPAQGADILRKRYPGEIVLAEDLSCIAP